MMSHPYAIEPADSIYTTLNCMNCGVTLIGRRDKKFCDDHCRSLFHNVTSAAHYNLIRKTHTILRKNRRILNLAMSVFQEQHVVPAHWLMQRGFSFQHCTQKIDCKDDSPLLVCYDVAYRWREQGVVQILFWSADSRAA